MQNGGIVGTGEIPKLAVLLRKVHQQRTSKRGEMLVVKIIIIEKRDSTRVSTRLNSRHVPLKLSGDRKRCVERQSCALWNLCEGIAVDVQCTAYALTDY
jgi:hypothetical protein